MFSKQPSEIIEETASAALDELYKKKRDNIDDTDRLWATVDAIIDFLDKHMKKDL